MSEKIRRLIQRAIVLAGGTEKSLALKLHLSQPLIHNCKKQGRCGPKLAIAIHQFSHGEIPGSELRPDLWQKPEDVPSAPEPEHETEREPEHAA